MLHHDSSKPDASIIQRRYPINTTNRALFYPTCCLVPNNTQTTTCTLNKSYFFTRHHASPFFHQRALHNSTKGIVSRFVQWALISLHLVSYCSLSPVYFLWSSRDIIPRKSFRSSQWRRGTNRNPKCWSDVNTAALGNECSTVEARERRQNCWRLAVVLGESIIICKRIVVSIKQLLSVFIAASGFQWGYLRSFLDNN